MYSSYYGRVDARARTPTMQPLLCRSTSSRTTGNTPASHTFQISNLLGSCCVIIISCCVLDHGEHWRRFMVCIVPVVIGSHWNESLYSHIANHLSFTWSIHQMRNARQVWTYTGSCPAIAGTAQSILASTTASQVPPSLFLL